jgi:hypothetical protein
MKPSGDKERVIKNIHIFAHVCRKECGKNKLGMNMGHYL